MVGKRCTVYRLSAYNERTDKHEPIRDFIDCKLSDVISFAKEHEGKACNSHFHLYTVEEYSYVCTELVGVISL